MPSRLDKYRPIAIWLHWIVGLALLGQLALGIYMHDLPRETPERAYYFNLHKSIGLTLALFILWRVLYRFRHEGPPLPTSVPEWQRTVSALTHRLLYVCMILMPITGYIGSSFAKYPTKFWGLELPSWGWDDKELRETCFEIHEIIAWVFMVLIALHIAAAFKHLLLDKNGVFQRMLPR